MNLLGALGLTPRERSLICLVGAGGKTTTMFTLAASLKTAGQKVLVTTTTKIYPPENNQYDSLLLEATNGPLKPDKIAAGTITCLGDQIGPENKMIGINKDRVDALFDTGCFDTIIVEGDGAKRKPIKAPGANEPVIPERTTLTIGVVGLDALEKPITDQNVHRWQEFCKITNTRENDRINESTIIRLITSPDGLFKNTPHQSRRIVFLNKADHPQRGVAANRIRRLIKSQYGIEVVITSAQKDMVMP